MLNHEAWVRHEKARIKREEGSDEAGPSPAQGIKMAPGNYNDPYKGRVPDFQNMKSEAIVGYVASGEIL